MRSSQRAATIREVASRAGVALSSVSRVLNDHPDVSGRMREKVLRAVDEFGYEPELLASSLRRGRTNTVGFIVADIVNPLCASILRDAERELRDAGYAVLLSHSEGNPARDAESARLFRRRRADGLLLSLTDEEWEETHSELREHDVPIVILDREVADGSAWSAVLADHRTGVRRVTEHLIDLDHRDTRLITGQRTSRPAQERAAGFQEAFARRGVPVPDDAVVHGNFSAAFAGRAIDELVARSQLPTALIAAGNLILTGIIAALHRHGVRIGREIALVTWDDIPSAEYHEPAILGVARDTERMAVLAAQMLLELLASGPPRSEVVPTDFLVRESTYPDR